MTSFLPEGYRAPEGNYAKLRQGDNNFRILGPAIVGWEYWNTANKPIRSAKQPSTLPSDIRVEKGKTPGFKHFWMFPIWSHDNGKIQLMEITQKSIQESIKALVSNAKWGDPTNYDITITKAGTNFDTTYQVVPTPPSPIDPSIISLYKSLNLNMEAIFEGGDPFLSVEAKPEEAEIMSVDEAIDILSPSARNIASG